MLAKDVATEGLNFALESHFKPGALQTEVKATDTRKERGDGI